MAKCRLGILTLLTYVALACAITWDAAPSTTLDARTLSTETLSQAPSATPAPTVVINGTTYESPNLCGYVEYSSANSYTCRGDNTCLWNSKLGLVGCGNPTSVNYYTACVPWRRLQECNSSCLADPSILRCSTPTPYCVTPIIGPHHNYSAFGCEATRIFGRYKVHLTYSGQNTTGHLPRYLGDDGIITYGTRSPKSTSLSSTISTSLSASSDPFLIATISSSITDEIQPTGWRKGNWTGAGGNNSDYTRHRSKWEEAQIRTEIIAGSVIGGFMFLLAGGLLIWLFFAWRRLKKAQMKQGSEPKDVRLQELGRDSVFTSEASSSGLGSRRTMSISTVMRERDRGDEERVRSPISPVSEVGSAYMSRGTSPLRVYDDIYDDEDGGRGRRAGIPVVVLSEGPEEVPRDEIYEAEDPSEEDRLAVPVAVVDISKPAEGPAEAEAEAIFAPASETISKEKVDQHAL